MINNKQYMVSVIMSVYNGEAYLREAIDSILCQTFQDFQFIIIEDASIDSTYDILKSYKDERIQIIRNTKNIGLTKSLNKALKYATGKYIARMDADDISEPSRLEKQVRFMERNKEVMLISCSFMRFGEQNHKTIIRMNENQIKGQLVFGSVLPHPGFMFRRELYSKYNIKYNEKMKYAQDYDFQARVSRRFKIACLSDILINYRISSGQISEQKYAEQQYCANLVRKKQLSYYGIQCRQEQVELLRKLYVNEQSEFNLIKTIKAYFFLIRFFIIIKQTKYTEKEVICEILNLYREKLNKVIKEKWKKNILQEK